MTRRPRRALGILAGVLMAALDAGGAPAAPAPEDAVSTLKRLNQEYVTAFLKSDVDKYRELLADDFAAVLSNGNFVNRDAFLAAASQPNTIGFFELLDVDVRVLGNFAIVRGRTSFRRADGTPGQNRYSNVYVLRGGRWQAVWAQVTPVQVPPAALKPAPVRP